ncbi:MAG TPA: FtsQ-type POTRA domain-containing protein [Pyrinomonadaceae bacterium]|nr:FtsQ-type POTRA domain-containing protein [Pyrinomonadaceae bacterium]
MRENVITTRAGRVGAGAKGRAGGAVQRPAPRRAKPAGQAKPRQKSFEWKSALVYVPLLLKLTLAVSLGVLAFVGYRAAVAASFFKVKTVDVDGATRASRDEIRAAALRLSNAGVWQADLEVIANEIKGLPWVRDAVVTRVLPAGLRVRVTEREPRIIARTSQGKLVWIDDDGVVLGSASPDERDFFVRGIDESRTDEAVKQNRERVKAALELASDLAQAGLSRRVSEVNLEDLRDVRVQLAGDDAAVEVRLGREDFAKRFRQALEVLDAQRSTPRGPFVTYVDVSQGKRAIIGTGATAHAPASAAATVEPPPATASEPARAASKGGKKTLKKDERPAAKADEKNEAGADDAALRPRRVN